MEHPSRSVSSLRLEVWNTPVQDLHVSRRSVGGNDPIGVLAKKLREYFCKGPHCVMLQTENELKWFPAFAALSADAAASTIHHYRNWVARVADKEYADTYCCCAIHSTRSPTALVDTGVPL